MDLFYKMIGAAGIISACAGIMTKRRKSQNKYYIIGGLLLEIYSLYLGDLLFIILEIIFTSAAIYDYIKISNKNTQ